MSIHDYLIDHRGFDWPSLLRNWIWLVPSEFTVWLMNRYGDLVIVTKDGKVHFLDVGSGTLELTAQSRDDFREKIDQDGNANDWLMIPLVDKLVAAGMTLGQSECYGYKIMPILGGDYTVENSFVVPVAEHYGVCAAVHQQTKDLPNGTKVVLKVVNLPG